MDNGAMCGLSRVADVRTVRHSRSARYRRAVYGEPIKDRDPRAYIVDLAMTQVVDGDFVKVMSWYDNECGYSSQLVREAVRIASEMEHRQIARESWATHIDTPIEVTYCAVIGMMTHVLEQPPARQPRLPGRREETKW
jgi:hypothetical protein